MNDGSLSGGGTSAGDVVYENTADPIWARKALDLHQKRRLQVAAFDTDGVVSARSGGPAPAAATTSTWRPL